MNRNLMAMALLIAALAGCATAPAPSPAAKAGVHFGGGDGSSVQKAVSVLGATEMTGVAAEYRWLDDRYPGYKMHDQSLLNQGQRAYDVMNFTMPDGSEHTVYFDITDFFGKM